ncbi:MAG: response regulator [Candidatus Cloacimonetes bacterium]|nr:response regulator [Candidatus Cloacimonadota bacterium]
MKKKIRILIVEDEVIIAQSLKLELENEGFEVCSFVASGEEAISEAKEKKPDVILMDIHLFGEIDGIEAALEIIAYKKNPIIFMTGYSESNIFVRAQKVNPIAYLHKPVEIYNLKPVIESIFD